DGLLVDAGDRDLVVALDGQRDAGRGLDGHGVREAERELDRGTLLGDAVTGADDLEALGVALRDADDLVRDEGAGEAVQRTRLALVVGARDEDLVVLDLHL